MACVLVVDDDGVIRETLRDLLEDAGHEVVEARDGQEALDRLRAAPDPLVVVLDVDMPRVDGLAVLRTVARHPPLAARRAFALVTAYDDRLFSSSILEILTALAVAVVRKPFEIDTLLEAVETAASRLA